jgi:uncharacterized membrane protein
MSLGNALRSRPFAVLGLSTAAADVAVLAEVPFLRVALGGLLILFLPGYAVVSVLRVGKGVERQTFAVGSSIVIVSLAGLVVHLSPYPISPATVLVPMNVVVFASIVAGTLRSKPSPETDGQRSSSAGFSGLLSFGTKTDSVLTVVLVGSLLLATGSVAYAVTTPGESESFTEFYLLAENDDGELVADGYPTEFDRNESQQLFLGIDNHAGRAMNYTVVVELQRVTTTNGSVTVIEERQLDEMGVEVDSGSSRTFPHQVSPSMTGQGLHLTYLLYEGSPPDNPTRENADQSLYLRIHVS